MNFLDSLGKEASEQNGELDLFRSAIERLCREEFLDAHQQWEEDGTVSRSAWRRAGELGLLCADLPEAEGGAGGSFRHSATVIEVLAASGLSGPCYGFMVHSDIVVPYIHHYGSDSIRRKWLPSMVSGDSIGAVAMTEPGAGSDLKAIRTSAVMQADGSYVMNGAKTFITNGGVADVVVVAAKTSPEKGAKGVSLFAVDCRSTGFRRGRNFEKLGMKASNTSELFFDDVHVPADAILGELDQGFRYLMTELPRERLVIAIAAMASAESVLRQTIEYTKQRKVFGKSVSEFQNTAFRLTELHSELVVARVFLNDCIRHQCSQSLDTETAAIAKIHLTELVGRVVDSCLQFYGGYGYMWEQPIARAYADARVLRIFGGTNEVLKDMISRKLLA